MTIENSGGDHLPVPVNSNASDRAGGFDYSGLPSNETNELFERRAQIQSAVKRTAAMVAATGDHLIVAKKILGHGRFVEWVEVECGLRIRTAQNYMTISRLLIKYAFVAHLPAGMVLRLSRVRGRRELLDRIAAAIGRDCRLTEDDLSALLKKFTTMRQLEPKRPRGHRRKTVLKPVERPSQKYGGLTKAEFAKFDAKYITEKWGYLGLCVFKNIVVTDTVLETMPFVEVEIRRCEFKIELNLRKSGIEEHAG
jgi:hypothetical protein